MGDIEVLKTKALKIIENQLRLLVSFKTKELSIYLPNFKKGTARMLENLITDEYLQIFVNISTDNPVITVREEFSNYLHQLRNGLNFSPEFFIASVRHQPIIHKSKNTNKVFIIHGHDELNKTIVARTIERLGLEAIILHEQSNEGKTIIEKLEHQTVGVKFAIAILSPDDIGYPIHKPKESKARARQNVVFELGYFLGILGRSNVCVLYREEVEMPSDYLGIIPIYMDDKGAWILEVGKELRQAGFNIDLNQFFKKH